MSYVLSNSRAGEDVYILRVKLDEFMDIPKPGQFYMIRAGKIAPLLNRPFAVFEYDSATHCVSFLYRVAGEGTEQITRIVNGQTIGVYGPYGKPFEFEKYNKLVLVGGGIGLAALNYIAQAVRFNSKDGTVRAYLGYSTEPFAVDYFNLNTSGNVEITTSGFITEIVDVQPDETVVGCGPEDMMVRLCRIVKPENDVFISLDAHMACGLGACLGCSREAPLLYKKSKRATPLLDFAGSRRVQVCTEGPIFKREVVKR